MLRCSPSLILPTWALLAVGCGASPAAHEPTPEPTTTPEDPTAVPAEPPGASTTPATPYEVHEWGLIDVQEDGSAELAAGAGAPPPSGMSVRKPVLYFHLPPGTDSLAVDVSARILNGSVYETFPTDSRPSPDVAHWAATLSATHCDTAPPGAAARDTRGRRFGVACGTPDGICEVTELPRYDAPSAACVTVGSERAGMLFYRGVLAPTLPLRVERLSDMTVRVTATGSMAGAPGEIVRISTALSGPWPVGHVVLSRAAFPTAGASVDMPVGTEVMASSSERATMAAALASLGLDEGESNAFLEAWMEGLFGPQAASRSARETVGAPGMPQDAVIYFLPEAAVDSLCHLELSPSPGRIRRAFMVRVILPGVPTA